MAGTNPITPDARTRRVMLGAVAAVPIAALPGPAWPVAAAQPEGLEAACAECGAVTAAQMEAQRALDVALDAAGQLQDLVHSLEDRADMLLSRIENTPAATLEEAQAKLRVAQALITKGTDPGRHRLLDAATGELLRFTRQTLASLAGRAVA